jgi:hypothetical protein
MKFFKGLIHSVSHLYFRFSGWLAVGAFFILLLSEDAAARAGGGQSYGGGGSSGGGSYGGGSSGGGGEGDILFYLIHFAIRHPKIGIPLLIVFIIFKIKFSSGQIKPTLVAHSSNEDNVYKRPNGLESVPLTGEGALQELVQKDPHFSLPVFRDFAASLYVKVYQAAANNLKNYEPYLNHQAMNSIVQLLKRTPSLTQISNVICGGVTLNQISFKEDRVRIDIHFESNYAVFSKEKPQGETFYLSEVWTFGRSTDILSANPAIVRKAGCPQCGAAMDRNPDGSCKFCQAKNEGANWKVDSIRLQNRHNRGPLLTTSVPEQGTDLPTVFQKNLTAKMAEFKALCPDFDLKKTGDEFRGIFLNIQKAWTEDRWEDLRPLETENVFQTHLFWLEEYRKQRLRNVLNNIEINALEFVKFNHDAYYFSIVCRIRAQCIDFTRNFSGKVISGSESKPREFTEYWTFIRSRAMPVHAKSSNVCPSCGATFTVQKSGSCSYCATALSSGDFGWVLSLIEQDESYRG